MLNLSPNSMSQGFHPHPDGVGYKLSDYNLVVSEPYTLNLSHLYKLPIVDEMRTDWNFNVELNAESAGRTSWMYSQKLNKVFVKINTALSVYLKYDIVDIQQPLFVRAMIVYTSCNDIADPVKKCPNHCSQSKTSNPEHILRCLFDETQYWGSDSGKLFIERLAVIIPMSAIASNEPLKLIFTCQNSCSGGMNRKATSIVFTLENSGREVLGRKIMNFKVCSCPKRDKDKDEEGVKTMPKKGKVEYTAPSTSMKVDKDEDGLKTMSKKRKIECTAPSTSKKVLSIVKQELDSTLSMQSDVSLVCLPSDLQSLNSGLVDFKKEPVCDVNITMPNPELAQEVLKFAYDKIAGEMFRSNDATYQTYLTNIAKQIGK